MANASLLARLMTDTWPVKTAKSAVEALMLPGQVAGGLLATQPSQPGHWSDIDEARQQKTQEGIGNRAFDLAGLLMGGGYGAAPAGAVGMSGARSGSKVPMDEASRTARMQQQGWHTDAYHGTDQQIKEFSNLARGTSTKAGSAKQAHWLAESPQTASGYADLATDRAVTDLINASQRAERNQQWDLAHDLIVKAEQLEKEVARGQNVIPAKLRGNFKEFDAEGKMVGDLGESQLNKWTQQAKAEGFDGLKVLNLSDEGGYGVYNPTTHYGVFEPKNIRSRFAAFDPANKDSGHLLGAGNPLAALLMQLPRDQR